MLRKSSQVRLSQPCAPHMYIHWGDNKLNLLKWNKSKRRYMRGKLTSFIATYSFVYIFFPAGPNDSRKSVCWKKMKGEANGHMVEIYGATHAKFAPLSCFLPKRSSPKLPQPIFFPTLKFGPTIIVLEALVEVFERSFRSLSLLLADRPPPGGSFFVSAIAPSASCPATRGRWTLRTPLDQFTTMCWKTA